METVLVIRNILVRIRIRGSAPWLLSSVTLKMQQKLFFPYFFLRNLIFAKILCKIFILQPLFQSTKHLYEKRVGSGAVPRTNGSGSERPKNMWILRIRIPNTGCKVRTLYLPPPAVSWVWMWMGMWGCFCLMASTRMVAARGFNSPAISWQKGKIQYR